MVLCPQTPTKKKPSAVVASPYFSPYSQRLQNGVTKVLKDELEASRDSGSNMDQDGIQHDDAQLSHDPLFRYYFKSFLKLYQRLEELKPKLIQESVAEDPWKVLVAVTLLNKTTAKVALPMFSHLMDKYQTPWDLARANEGELGELLRPLGTYNMRSRRLIDLSKAYMREPPSVSDLRASKPSPSPFSTQANVQWHQRYPHTPISHLPGTGPYALDSYRIFCTTHGGSKDEWKSVMPTDKELIRYLKWKWAFQERRVWEPPTGVFGPVDIPYLKILIAVLEQTT